MNHDVVTKSFRSAFVLGFLAVLGAVWAQDGADVFSQNCASCHQSEGQGVAGSFPPLAGTLPAFLEHEDGRSVLVEIVLYGMRGEIRALGESYDGSMPSWRDSLSDAEVAAVLDHALTSWDNEDALPDDFAPIEEAEVAELRDQGLEPEDVHERWQELGLE